MAEFGVKDAVSEVGGTIVSISWVDAGRVVLLRMRPEVVSFWTAGTPPAGGELYTVVHKSVVAGGAVDPPNWLRIRNPGATSRYHYGGMSRRVARGDSIRFINPDLGDLQDALGTVVWARAHCPTALGGAKYAGEVPTTSGATEAQGSVGGVWRPDAGALLTVALNTTDTSMVVTSAKSYPDEGVVKIGDEEIGFTGRVSGGGTEALTGLTRGANGSTAAAHSINDVVLDWTGGGYFPNRYVIREADSINFTYEGAAWRDRDELGSIPWGQNYIPNSPALVAYRYTSGGSAGMAGPIVPARAMAVAAAAAYVAGGKPMANAWMYLMLMAVWRFGAESQLTAAISNSQVSIGVANAKEWPVEGVVLIESERVRYFDRSESTLLQCSRGADGTAAAAHALGALAQEITVDDDWRAETSPAWLFPPFGDGSAYGCPNIGLAGGEPDPAKTISVFAFDPGSSAWVATPLVYDGESLAGHKELVIPLDGHWHWFRDVAGDLWAALPMPLWGRSVKIEYTPLAGTEPALDLTTAPPSSPGVPGPYWDDSDAYLAANGFADAAAFRLAMDVVCVELADSGPGGELRDYIIARGMPAGTRIEAAGRSVMPPTRFAEVSGGALVFGATGYEVEVWHTTLTPTPSSALIADAYVAVDAANGALSIAPAEIATWNSAVDHCLEMRRKSGGGTGAAWMYRKQSITAEHVTYLRDAIRRLAWFESANPFTSRSLYAWSPYSGPFWRDGEIRALMHQDSAHRHSWFDLGTVELTGWAASVGGIAAPHGGTGGMTAAQSTAPIAPADVLGSMFDAYDTTWDAVYFRVADAPESFEVGGLPYRGGPEFFKNLHATVLQRADASLMWLNQVFEIDPAVLGRLRGAWVAQAFIDVKLTDMVVQYATATWGDIDPVTGLAVPVGTLSATSRALSIVAYVGTPRTIPGVSPAEEGWTFVRAGVASFTLPAGDNKWHTVDVTDLIVKAADWRVADGSKLFLAVEPGIGGTPTEGAASTHRLWSACQSLAFTVGDYHATTNPNGYKPGAPAPGWEDGKTGIASDGFESGYLLTYDAIAFRNLKIRLDWTAIEDDTAAGHLALMSWGVGNAPAFE